MDSAPSAAALDLFGLEGLTPFQQLLCKRLDGRTIRPGFTIHHPGASILGHGNGYATIRDPERWVPAFREDLVRDYGYARMMLVDLAFTIFERGRVEEGWMR